MYGTRRPWINAIALAVLAVGAAPALPSPQTAGPASVEPDAGRLFHGTSPDPTDVDAYIAALGDPALLPAVEGMHAGVPGTRPTNLDKNTRAFLQRQKAAGRIPHLSFSMSIGDGQAVDDVIATSTTYDDLIRTVGRAVRDHGDFVFVRIGFEFNGSWNNYHPGLYPVAFRKFVDLMRSEGAYNFATIWCYEPDAPDDFDATDAGQPRWYPGDAYVDWFGLDLFNHRHFTEEPGREGEPGPYQRSQRFLQMARDRGKPVFLSELAAVDAHVTPTAEDPGLADGRHDWDLWFDPLFALLDAHPEIKGLNYMSQDYRGTQYEALGWGNARIQDNAYILERWREELLEDRFVHAATDRIRPASTLDPPPPALSETAGLRLSGRATDDAVGIDRVVVAYRNAATGAVALVAAALACDPARLSCTFTAAAPAPGVWEATVRAWDRAGNIESPGSALPRVAALP